MTMATILRSSKYVRNFAEFSTKLGFTQIKCDTRVSLISHRPSLSSTLAKSLATQAAPQRLNNESKLEITLQKLDTEVKRSGRLSRGRLEQILNTFQNSESVTSTQALMVIRCCGNLVPDELPEARSKLVNQVWESLENTGIQLDLSHYNALLRVYVENEYAFSPTEILAELERKGIEPNKLTYQRLINRYCQQGDIDGATKILEFMREKGISINETIFTALVRGHSEAGDMVSAADILTVMRQAGLEPTPDTYKELLCGYAKHGDNESIARTLSECKSRNVHLLDTDFLDVIFSLASHGHDEHVPGIISIMPKEVSYAPDALAHILKLVDIGKLDISMQILSSIPNRTKGQTGFSVIKQLTKSNMSVTQLIDFCKEIESKGINSRALLIALESYLVEGNTEGSLAVLDVLRESGREIREHYFWPIFTALGRSKDNAGIDNVLRRMRSDYSVVVSGHTLRDYVVPNKAGETDDIFSQLLLSGISAGSIASAIVYNLIYNMKLKDAADFAPQYVFGYNSAVFSKPLATALAHTNDVTSFITILHHIHENRTRQLAKGTEDQVFPVQERVLEPYIIEIGAIIKDQRSEILTKVLEGMRADGFQISDSGVIALRQVLGRRLTPQLMKLISELHTGNRNVRPVSHTDPKVIRSEILSLERSLQSPNNDEQSIVSIKKRLLYQYCKIKDLANMEKLLTEFEAFGVQLAHSMFKPLINAYLDSDILDKSEKYITTLLQVNPESVLSNARLIKYISLLVKNDRLDDAVEFLQANKDNVIKNTADNSNLWCRLLNTLADDGAPKAVNTIFDVLLKNECITLSGSNLGPLIRAHIVKGDLKEALNEFERICETYQHTPTKNELAKKLIEAEDATALQRLTDLSTQVHGETNSLYDLALSFVECNCIRQAKKILEIPALLPRVQKLIIASERYSELGLTVYLERLISTTKDLPSHKSIPEFYINLLRCYSKENNWEKGLSLYNQMIEEEVDPSNVFLVNLSELLKRNYQPVPFPVPELSIHEQTASQTRKSDKKNSADQQTVSEAEDGGGHDKTAHRRSSELVYAEKESELILSLLQSDELNSAVEITETLLAKNVYPHEKTFRFLIKKLGIAGDIESLKKLGEKLSRSVKRIVRFDHHLCGAHVAAGKTEEYLDTLEKRLEVVNASDAGKNVTEFPLSGIINLLQKHPESVERFAKIAAKYAAQGIIMPVNALWMYYILNNNPEADKIWSEHLVNSPEFKFHSIIHSAQRSNDSELAIRLIKTIETAPHVDNYSRGWIYSVLVESYCKQGKFQESIDSLRDALKKVPAQRLRRILVKVESILAENGLALPADISTQIPTTEGREQV